MRAPQTPDDLIEVANSFFAPRALMAATRLDVFGALAEGPLDADGAAARLGTDARATGILLRALVAIGVLDLDRHGRYALTELARLCLVPGSPRDLSAYFNLDADTFQSWARLEEAVRTGKPIEVSSKAAAEGNGADAEAAAGSKTARDPAEAKRRRERHRTFITAMRSTALGNAPLVAERLEELATRTHVLDFGAGPGTYAIEFCRRHPGLRATLLDLPEAVAIAREVVAGDAPPDVAARISFLAGDFHKDTLGGPYDFAWLSHVVHGHPESSLAPLFLRIRAALAQGGTIAIHDFILDPTRTQPPFGAVMSLNFLVMSDGGRCWGFDELRAVLERSGFADVRLRDLAEPRGIRIVLADAR